MSNFWGAVQTSNLSFRRPFSLSLFMQAYEGCPIFLTFLAFKRAIIIKQETTK